MNPFADILRRRFGESGLSVNRPARQAGTNHADTHVFITDPDVRPTAAARALRCAGR